MISESHGGEVDAAAEAYDIPRDRWIDLSTGINAIPYPFPDVSREYWHRLPDKALDAWLREEAAACYGVADPAFVVPAAGSQALIQVLPRLVPGSSVAVLGPTYREHSECWADGGHAVVEVERLEDVPESAQVIVVVNPNNPDGALRDPGRLLVAATGRLLVVDEAFADVVPHVSLAPRVGRDGLVVLRSVGKFYGLAGMRLGFALAGEPMARALRRAVGPWAVSGPASAIGAVALADEGWARATRIRLMAAVGKLDGLLLRTGLRIIGGTGLFRLTEFARAAELFDHLARAAILVRRFAEHRTWLRFGIPGEEGEFERLGQALAAWRPQAVMPGHSSSPSHASGHSAGQPHRSGIYQSTGKTTGAADQ